MIEYWVLLDKLTASAQSLLNIFNSQCLYYEQKSLVNNNDDIHLLRLYIFIS
jgi:hypothetical protein